VFVARPVYDRFVAALRPLVEKANPVRLATPGQAAQAGRLVGEAAGKECEVVNRRDKPGGSSDVAPTLILNAPPDLAACREASFAPLTTVAWFDALDHAVRMHAASPFGLAAAVFTPDPAAAAELAGRLPVGMVVVNDVIAPTAHPATPFGGRKASGWGSTQGAEGLLGMTVPQVVTVRTGTFRPHVDAFLAGDPAAGDVARGLLRFTHARRLRDRLGGLRQLVNGLRRAKKS
jgi:aldehyde dehydrogenase (NAD+)